MMRFPYLLGAALLLLPALPGRAQDELHYKSFKGQTPPELEVRAKDFLNTRKPFSLKSLRGQVVWLEFSFIH
jgi:hypothetical protein